MDTLESLPAARRPVRRIACRPFPAPPARATFPTAEKAAELFPQETVELGQESR